MELRKFIATTVCEYLNENYLKSDINDILYGDYHHIFKNKIKSHHGRIEDGLIVRFYINEYLKYYDIDNLKGVASWDDFITIIHDIWNRKKTSPNQEIVFRRGKNIESDMFFSNNIYVASVYSGILNAYILNLKNPYTLNCNDSDWMNIDEPEIMRGESYDGKVSTDNIVDFIKKLKKYDGIVFKNLYEGSGAEVFGTSTIYVSLDGNNVVNLTNN